jgi:2-polyprenyl-6-methoxyphenol hydroxylase-like FAD-dependent oxidoreductase
MAWLYCRLPSRALFTEYGALLSDGWRCATREQFGGSGTKLAMESAISMADYLASEPTPQAAFAKYEDARRTEVLRLQSAARNSLEWFEDVER